jgi:hypothetical protein
VSRITRRRSTDAPEECWHVYYGDVHAGTIAIRAGIPHDKDPWGWNCDFYPGLHPREHLSPAFAALVHLARYFPLTTKSVRLPSDISERQFELVAVQQSVTASVSPCSAIMLQTLGLSHRSRPWLLRNLDC